MISLIKLNDDVITPTSTELAEIDDEYWVAFVTLTKLSTFETVVGFEVNPPSIIFVTILNDEETFVTSAELPLLADVNCVTPDTFMLPFVFDVITGDDKSMFCATFLATPLA